ncbi:MAG TPA: GAF domain-containing sensor histidine kinase [Anaerolineae bacterium]|nr:GAF domain-containing sensor histidine kinase [Anaerolineae bacterium]
MRQDPRQRKRDGKRVARLERLIEVSRALNSTLSLRPLLHDIVVAAQELTDTEACSIMLVDRNSGLLYFEEATNLTGIRSIVVPMEGSVAGWVVKTGEPVVIADARSDPRFYRKVDEQSTFVTQSILAVPMIARGNVIGVLEAINKRNGVAFTDEDVELLAVVGDQAAVAVQNALLFQQSDLIAEIVHEMRTPLTSIIAYAELIQRSETPMEQRSQFADIIRREAERINEVTKNFLELARLESGRASLARDPVYLTTVIHMAVNVMRPQADAKPVRILVDVPPTLPPVMGDAQRLHQALLNLLSNAVKYSRPGDSITVNANCEGNRLAVSVADTGPGIPAEALPRLFERFYRVPGAERQALGTGLGLSITRQIIEVHGGEIHAASEEGRGTIFTFTLPAGCPQA